MQSPTNLLIRILVGLFSVLFKLLISFAVGVFVLPLAILVYVFHHVLIRTVLSVYLAVRFEGKMKLVSDGGDAMFGYKSEGNGRNIVVSLECKKNSEVIHINKEVATRMMNVAIGNKRPYEKLKYIFTKHLGYFCWKYDENFSLDNHLKIHGERVEQEKYLKIIGELEEDMTDEHPQWQFLFFSNYINQKGEERSSVVVRFHHSILDGLSIINFVIHCLGAVVSEEALDHMKSSVGKEMLPPPNPESFPYILNPLTFSVPLQYRIIYHVNCALFGFYHLLKTVTSTRIHWRPKSKYPGGQKCYLMSDHISMETMTIIRKNCRVSVYSILAYAFARALEKGMSSHLPKKEILVGHSLAILPYPDCYFHNRFTLMTVPYRINSDLGGKARLIEYHRQSTKAIRGPEYSLYYWFFQFYGKFPAAMFKFPLKKPRFTFLINSLPFSRKELVVWNHWILSVVGWPPYTTDGGIGLSCVGYCDSIRVGATADSSWMSEEELKIALENMVEEIKLLGAECSLTDV